ncbi:MAG TPA: SMP-30/gluconolactonase/LRE family protein [Robiginitalea sp.]|nr:SMP-30/gluconolactonase/LRE family protein [Robiginitalea sp.]
MSEPVRIAFETITDHRSRLGEGPVWDTKRQALCWVDITAGHIHEYRPRDGRHRRLDVGERVGAVALFPNGDYLAALESGLVRLGRKSGARTPLCHPESVHPGNRYNDGKCDPSGRFWIGSMALDERPGAGSLYMLKPDLSAELKIGGVGISNGLAWSRDQRTMYYIDSPTRQVQAFDFEPETGDLTNRRVAFSVPASEGVPDGMTIDREGMLWIGHWDGWQVARWDPERGEKLVGWKLPAARITSCTFGGDGLGDLYVTSAREGLSERELASQPMAGAVFVFKDCGYRGWDTVRCRYSKPESP